MEEIKKKTYSMNDYRLKTLRQSIKAMKETIENLQKSIEEQNSLIELILKDENI